MRLRYLRFAEKILQNNEINETKLKHNTYSLYRSISICFYDIFSENSTYLTDGMFNVLYWLGGELFTHSKMLNFVKQKIAFGFNVITKHGIKTSRIFASI